jgi:hypothetical protein
VIPTIQDRLNHLLGLRAIFGFRLPLDVMGRHGSSPDWRDPSLGAEFYQTHTVRKGIPTPQHHVLLIHSVPCTDGRVKPAKFSESFEK